MRNQQFTLTPGPRPPRAAPAARVLLACVFFVSLFPLRAQEPGPAATESPALSTGETPAVPEAETTALPEAENAVVYVIRNIEFDIKGRSRPFALRYHGQLSEGELIRGPEALELYIKNHTQLLVNQRVLNSDARITYTLGEAEGDGKIPVNLLVSVSDTWNIMILPKPVWDSNDGFDFTLKARDYNFMGTMTPLRLDLGYQLNTRNESSFKFLIDADIPFTALGFNWNINFDNEFNYTWQEALGYTNTAGLSMELPWQRTTFVFDAAHQFIWYPKNSEEDEKTYGKYFEGLLGSLSFGVEWKIPTGLDVSGYGELSYTPRVSQSFNYRPGGWDPCEWENSRRSVSTGLDQTLGFGQIDWIGNFRRGLEASFDNTNRYDYVSRTWDNYYSLNAAGHFIFTGFFGITSRLKFRHWLYHDASSFYNDAGDVLRGVLDNRIRARAMLSLNLEFPFRTLVIRPSEWFNNSKMRLFNFELFLSPVLDFGLACLPGPSGDQEALTAYYTGGLEMLVFPEIMRSFYLRFSFGADLENAARTGRIFSDGEFSLGLGHFFD